MSTDAELAAAVKSLVAGTTVLIAPGVYRPAAPIAVGRVADVVIRGESEAARDVTIEGPGFMAGDDTAAPHAFVIHGHRVTLANLTVREFPGAAVVFESGAFSPRLYNVVSIDNRGSVLAGMAGRAVSGGTIEYSRFEYTADAATGMNAPAMDVRGGSGWMIRYNVFRNLRIVDGAAGPAVLLHSSATGATVDSNTFVNCAREIVLGSMMRDEADRTSGLVRNNFIVRDGATAGPAAITLAGSAGSRVLHNTVLTNGAHANAIEVNFPATRNVRVQNNLLDAAVVLRDGATGLVAPNDTSASPAYFVDPAEGDLHLSAAAASAIDAAPAVDDVATDWDGQARPSGTARDYGADELLASDAISPDFTASLPDEGSTATAADAAADGRMTTLAAAATTASALPSPWATRDIGSPKIAGAASYASGTYSVVGAGEGIYGTTDQFRFVYQPLAGDGEIVARIATMTTANRWAKAGVMIRQSLTASSAYAMALVSLKSGLNFQRRRAAGADTRNTSGGSGSVPQWVRIVRSGSSLSAYRSSNGTSWTRIGVDTVSVSGTVYVGLAVTSHRPSGSTTARFTNVSVRASTSNRLPTVSITSPASGHTFTAPATVSVAASAVDSDGSIAKVEFYLGSRLLGSDSASPYTASTGSLAAGTYSLTAVAQDNTGGRATSAAVKFTVSTSLSAASGTLKFNPSADHATLVTKYVFEVFAAGANPSTTAPVRKVDLGKPPVVDSAISVNVAPTIEALSPGSYFGTVLAVSTGGSSRSTPSNSFSR